MPAEPIAARPDVERRRRELALTMTWLRELRAARGPRGLEDREKRFRSG
jgi:hypothetical protein